MLHELVDALKLPFARRAPGHDNTASASGYRRVHGEASKPKREQAAKIIGGCFLAAS